MGKDSKVLRVFISSTSTDLLEYRDRVHHALGRMNLETSRMEAFVAAPKAPLAECRRLAAAADLLVVIVAHRYGWIPSVADGGDGEKSIRGTRSRQRRKTGNRFWPSWWPKMRTGRAREPKSVD